MIAFQSGRARAPTTVHLQGLVGVAQQSAGGTACCKATGRTVTHAADVVVMSLDSRRNPSIHLSLKHSTYTITTWTAGCRTHRNPYRAASRTNLPLSAEKMPVSSEINSADSPKTPSWTRVRITTKVPAGKFGYDLVCGSFHNSRGIWIEVFPVWRRLGAGQLSPPRQLLTAGNQARPDGKREIHPDPLQQHDRAIAKAD